MFKMKKHTAITISLTSLFLALTLVLTPFTALAATQASNGIEEISEPYTTENQLGVPFDFGVFTFDSLSFNTHFNTNFATPNLVNPGANFGNKQAPGISYFQSLGQGAHLQDGSLASMLVVGDQITATRNGGQYFVNGSPLSTSQIKVIGKETDTANNPYINFADQKAAMTELSGRLTVFGNGENQFQQGQQSDFKYFATGGADDTVLNVKASNMSDKKMYIKDAFGGGTTIVNVDLEGKSNVSLNEMWLADKNGNRVSTSENHSQNLKVLFNFYNGAASGSTIHMMGVWQGAILAPNVTIDGGNSNMEGTFIANSYKNGGEYHQWDFVGDFPAEPELPYFVSISATKVIDGTGKDSDEARNTKFDFLLKQGGDTVGTGSVTGAGEVTFGGWSEDFVKQLMNPKNGGKNPSSDIELTIREIVPTNTSDGWKYDPTTHKVKLKFNGVEAGKYIWTAFYDNGTETPSVFTNTYNESGSSSSSSDSSSSSSSSSSDSSSSSSSSSSDSSSSSSSSSSDSSSSSSSSSSDSSSTSGSSSSDSSSSSSSSSSDSSSNSGSSSSNSSSSSSSSSNNSSSGSSSSSSDSSSSSSSSSSDSSSGSSTPSNNSSSSSKPTNGGGTNNPGGSNSSRPTETIPDESVPLAPPTSSSGSGIEDISDASVPLAAPSHPASNAKTEQIDGDAVPLASPKTGEARLPAAVAAGAAIVSLGTILILRNKKSGK